jgi:hypothetical protein
MSHQRLYGFRLPGPDQDLQARSANAESSIVTRKCGAYAAKRKSSVLKHFDFHQNLIKTYLKQPPNLLLLSIVPQIQQ